MTTSPASSPVLVCTDFSSRSGLALQRAQRLSQVMQAPLEVLHVMGGAVLDDLRVWLGLGGSAEQALLDDAQQRANAWLKTWGAEGHAAAGVQVVSGHAVAEIVSHIRQSGAGLVLVGARGEGDLLHMVVGSTAERLLRRTPTPLLMVRQPVLGPYRRVLVPVDFSPWSAATIQAVRHMAPGAHLVLLHAWDVPFAGKLQLAGVNQDTVAHYGQQARTQAERQLHQLAQAQGLQPGEWTPCLAQGDASHCILAQADQRQCDLIAMGKHGRHVAEDLLLGSDTQHVLAETTLDVLVCPLPITAS